MRTEKSNRQIKAGPHCRKPANNTKSEEDYSDISAAGAILCKHFPAAFGKGQPLAVGIHKEIFPHLEALGISKTALRAALKYYVNGPAYLKALAQPGAVRVDLAGQPVETVSRAHRERAQALLDARRTGKPLPPKPRPAASLKTSTGLALKVTLGRPTLSLKARKSQ